MPLAMDNSEHAQMVQYKMKFAMRGSAAAQKSLEMMPT
jgi:hypothetical protein